MPPNLKTWQVWPEPLLYTEQIEKRSDERIIATCATRSWNEGHICLVENLRNLGFSGEVL